MMRVVNLILKSQYHTCGQYNICKVVNMILISSHHLPHVAAMGAADDIQGAVIFKSHQVNGIPHPCRVHRLCQFCQFDQMPSTSSITIIYYRTQTYGPSPENKQTNKPKLSSPSLLPHVPHRPQINIHHHLRGGIIQPCLPNHIPHHLPRFLPLGSWRRRDLNGPVSLASLDSG